MIIGDVDVVVVFVVGEFGIDWYFVGVCLEDKVLKVKEL